MSDREELEMFVNDLIDSQHKDDASPCDGGEDDTE